MRYPVLVLSALALVACGGNVAGPNNPGGGNGSNTLTATIDGQAFAATLVQANPVAATPGSLAFFGTQTSGGVTRSLTITLAFITGPGTYPLGTNIGSTPGGLAIYAAGPTPYSTPLSGTAGTITITTLTATRVTGTFTFTATPSVGAGAAAVATNGRFDVPLSSGYVAPTADQAGSVITANINGTPRVIATIVGLGGGTQTRTLGGQDLTYSINIIVSPATAPGSGALTGNTVPLRRITIQQVGTTQSWGGAGSDVGTLTITSISPTRISGTFTGTLAANAQTTGTLSIVNGVFDVRTPTP